MMAPDLLLYDKPPSPQSGSAESKISDKLQQTTMAKENDQGSFHVNESLYNVNIKFDAAFNKLL